MDEKDKNNLEAQVAEDKKEIKAQDKMLQEQAEETEEIKEEIRDFSENNPESGGPLSNWNQGGSWWILCLAGILIVFLVIWVCFFYGPN